MAEPKKYLDLNGVKVFWNESKKYIDNIAKDIKDRAADVSSLEFNKTADISDSGISITLNKSNISGTTSNTSINLPLANEEGAGIITEIVEGNGIIVESPKNGSIKLNLNTDNTSIKVDESGKLGIDTIDGGTF